MSMGDFPPSYNLLSTSLSASVPLNILRIKAKGGPDDNDHARAREFGQVLGEHGDKLIYKSKKKGETAKLFNELSHAIAVLSFCPGGIEIFGNKWESRIE